MYHSTFIANILLVFCPNLLFLFKNPLFFRIQQPKTADKEVMRTNLLNG